MSIHKLYFLLFSALLATACSSDVFLVHNGNMPTPDKVSQIKTGQTSDEVQAILGSPSAVTSFDGNTWIYMSSTLKKVAFFKPKEMERDVLSIKFDANNQVTEIIRYNKESGKNIAIDTTETETAGDDIGFFRKYFGGVGAYLPISPSNTERY